MIAQTGADPAAGKGGGQSYLQSQCHVSGTEAFAQGVDGGQGPAGPPGSVPEYRSKVNI